jgi:hypothetical protein
MTKAWLEWAQDTQKESKWSPRNEGVIGRNSQKRVVFLNKKKYIHVYKLMCMNQTKVKRKVTIQERKGHFLEQCP